MFSRTAADQTHHVGLPNSRGQSLARDVTHDQSKSRTEFHHLEEVSGEMTYRENFASDFELTPDELARCAESALHLGGLIDGFLQFCLVAEHRIKFLLYRQHVSRKAFRRGRRAWTRVPLEFRLAPQAASHRALPDVQNFLGRSHIHLIL